MQAMRWSKEAVKLGQSSLRGVPLRVALLFYAWACAEPSRAALDPLIYHMYQGGYAYRNDTTQLSQQGEEPKALKTSFPALLLFSTQLLTQQSREPRSFLAHNQIQHWQSLGCSQHFHLPSFSPYVKGSFTFMPKSKLRYLLKRPPSVLFWRPLLSAN